MTDIGILATPFEAREMEPRLGFIALLLMLSSANLSGSQKPSAAWQCHQILATLGSQDLTKLSPKEMFDTRIKIHDCVKASYTRLTPKDLSNAEELSFSLSTGIMIKMANDAGELQTTIFQLQDKIDQLTNANSAPNDELKVTIETLPTGYSRVIKVGGSARQCASDGPETMKCGWDVPSLTAMVAKIWTGRTSTPYVIFCQPSDSCNRMVPGEYRGKMAGSEGLVISGLVREGTTGETPHHGVYTILPYWD